MNYRVEDIESQLRSGEDSGWEFKQVEFAGDRPKRPTRGDWADEIAAFANAAGRVVLAGVSDDGHVIGMSRAQIANLDSLLVEVSTAIRSSRPFASAHITRNCPTASWCCWPRCR